MIDLKGNRMKSLSFFPENLLKRAAGKRLDEPDQRLPQGKEGKADSLFPVDLDVAQRRSETFPVKLRGRLDALDQDPEGVDLFDLHL
jgi:hypothetical protein